MAFIQTRGEPTVHQVEWFELFGRLGVSAIGYPLEYVKVLIQVIMTTLLFLYLIKFYIFFP